MPSQQDDKLTVNTNCVKAAARGDQAAVEAFLTGQCCLLICLSELHSHCSGSYSSSEFVIIPDNSTLVTCLHQAACKVSESESLCLYYTLGHYFRPVILEDPVICK